MRIVMLRLIDPLYPKSVQYWISPCYTSVLYNRVVMRIKDMMTQDEVNNWHSNNIFPLQWTLSWRPLLVSDHLL